MSCLPTCWSNSTKRRSDGSASSNAKKRKTGNSEVSKMVHHYLREMNACIENETEQFVNEPLPASLISGSTPYLKLLGSLDEGASQSIPVITRKYEENYMRECISKSETPCSMGINCECMHIDESVPFVGVCFPIPNYNTGELIDNTMCVLCLRKVTQLLFYHVIQCGMRVDNLIQKYGNICNQKGEYHPSAMLICPPSSSAGCMPLPIVAHQRNRYKIERVSGVIWLRQERVFMEDF